MPKDRCEHVVKLEQYMRDNGIDVYSEHGEEPRGWVNVTCETCKSTFEIRLNTRVD